MCLLVKNTNKQKNIEIKSMKWIGDNTDHRQKGN